MGAKVYLMEGTGRAVCHICKKKIMKHQRQMNFKGWDASAAVHSDSMDCNRRKRFSIQTGGA